VFSDGPQQGVHPWIVGDAWVIGDAVQARGDARFPVEIVEEASQAKPELLAATDE
jgi:hypothetical protein